MSEKFSDDLDAYLDHKARRWDSDNDEWHNRYEVLRGAFE
jgi:hypothetical protein